MARVYDVRILLIQALTEARHLQLKTRTLIMRARNMMDLREHFKIDVIKSLLIIDYLLNVIIAKLEYLVRLGRPVPVDVYLLVRLSGEVSRYSRILPPEMEYSASDLEILIGYIYSSVLSSHDKVYVESAYGDSVLAQVKSILQQAEENASSIVSTLL